MSARRACRRAARASTRSSSSSATTASRHPCAPSSPRESRPNGPLRARGDLPRRRPFETRLAEIETLDDGHVPPTPKLAEGGVREANEVAIGDVDGLAVIARVEDRLL